MRAIAAVVVTLCLFVPQFLTAQIPAPRITYAEEPIGDFSVIHTAWEPTPNALYYTLDVATDSAFAFTVVSFKVPKAYNSFTKKFSDTVAYIRYIPSPNVYFLRVRAQTPQGTSPFSNIARTTLGSAVTPGGVTTASMILRIASVNTLYNVEARWNAIEPKQAYIVGLGIPRSIAYFQRFLDPFVGATTTTFVASDVPVSNPPGLQAFVRSNTSRTEATANFFFIRNDQWQYLHRYEEMLYPELPITGDSTYYAYDFLNSSRFEITRWGADSVLLNMARAGLPLDSAWFRETWNDDLFITNPNSYFQFVVKLRAQDQRISRFGKWKPMSELYSKTGFEGGGYNWAFAQWSSTTGPYAFRYTYKRTTSVQQPDEIPSAPVLYAPAPNPTSDESTIRIALPRKAQVRVEVLDLLGRNRLVAFDRALDGGLSSLPIQTAGLNSGTYIIRCSIIDDKGTHIRSHTLTVLR